MCNPRSATGVLMLALLVVSVRASAQEVAASALLGPETVRLSERDPALVAELYRPAGPGPFASLVFDDGDSGASAPAAVAALGRLAAERGWALLVPHRRSDRPAAASPLGLDASIEVAAARGAQRALPMIAGIGLLVLAVVIASLRKRRVACALAVATVLIGAYATYRVIGNAAGAKVVLERLHADPLADRIVASAWLRRQPFADANRIATAGYSFGGVVSLLAAAGPEYCAVVDVGGGARSWSASTELRRELARAARGARVPVLFLQAENDYTTEPTTVLAREVRNVGTVSERLLYPPFGDSAADARAFGLRGAAIWGGDVFGFLDKHCGTELVTRETPFAIYSGFWMNLHHVLYAEAWRRRGGESRSAGTLGEPPTAELTADEQRAWNAALEFYDRRIADRDLLLGLTGTRLALVDAGMAEPNYLPDPQHLDVLLAAAPVYRAHWWPEHDAANRAWIAEVVPKLAALSPEVPARLASVSKRPWFEREVRVDVVRVASAEGGYTGFNPAPAHITIASADPRQQDWHAAEAMFHQASHALANPILGEVILASSRTALGYERSRDLWHAALYYMTGEVVRQALAARDVEYEPILQAIGSLEDEWSAFRTPLETYWRPYVDGDAALDTAVRNLVAAVDAATEP